MRFFTMTIFGSMYYIVPRLVGREWRYGSLIKLHFWASAYGIGLMTLMLLAAAFCKARTWKTRGCHSAKALKQCCHIFADAALPAFC
jgi:Cbb3-type cytochrome oxidase, subunit 1